MRKSSLVQDKDHMLMKRSCFLVDFALYGPTFINGMRS